MKILVVFIAVCIGVDLCQATCTKSDECHCLNIVTGMYIGKCVNGMCACHVHARRQGPHVVCVTDADCGTYAADHCHHGQSAFCHHDHGQSDHDHGHCTCHH